MFRVCAAARRRRGARTRRACRGADSTEDSTIATPDAVAKALCAHDGLTGVCPKNAHAFRAKAAGTSNSETQIAVRNARKVGPVEVHEIDINLVDRDRLRAVGNRRHRRPGLRRAARRGGSDRLFKAPAEGRRRPRPRSNISAHQAPIRALRRRHGLLRRSVAALLGARRPDSRAFDEAAPRSETNRPLRVDAATARAPADPPRGPPAS